MKNFYQSGLSVLVICGIHGNESAAVKTVMELKKIINNANKESYLGISSVEFVLGVNKQGLRENKREWREETPSFSFDMNRAFEKENKVFEKCFEEVVEDTKEIVKKYDVVIDVHNSPNCIPCFLIDLGMPKSCWLAGFAKSMKSGILQPVVRRSGVNSLKNFVNSLTDSKYMHIGFTVELGGMGFECGKDLKQLANRLSDFIKELPKLQDCEFLKLKSNDAALTIFSVEEGIVKWKKTNVNSYYQKDEEICSITDYDENIKETIVAPEDGCLVGVNESYYIKDFVGEFQPFNNKEVFDKGMRNEE